MFKTVIALMLSLSLFSAHASTIEALESAFDELNYGLTVEWDQKDQKFFDAQLKQFNDEITVLRDQGLTNKQLLDALFSRVKDKKLATDLRVAFAHIKANKMKAVEAEQYVTEIISKSYSQGSSWRGEVRNISLLLGISVVWWVGVILIDSSCDCFHTDF